MPNRSFGTIEPTSTVCETALASRQLIRLRRTTRTPVARPSLLAAMARVPPVGDHIVLSCDGTHVTFGTVKVGAKGQSVSTALLDATPTHDWMRGLAVSYA